MSVFGRSQPRSRPPPFDREKFVAPSPPLDSADMYGELCPPVLAGLLSHLELVGPRTEDLFMGNPRVRDINDVLEGVHEAGPHADVEHITRGDAQLAASALAAYTRQLPEALLPSPTCDQMFAALELDDYAYKIAAIRDAASELPEANHAVLHRLFYFLNKLGGANAVGGNAFEDLATFWSSMLLPTSGARSRSHRVREFRLVGLLLQHCACVFQGALETLDVREPSAGRPRRAARARSARARARSPPRAPTAPAPAPRSCPSCRCRATWLPSSRRRRRARGSGCGSGRRCYATRAASSRWW